MDLYSAEIKRLNATPPNFALSDEADHVVKAYNTFCGDKFRIFISENDRIEEVLFHGYGCAVSKASSAIATEYLKGKSWSEVVDDCKQVVDFLSGEDREIDAIDPRLKDFAVVRKYPGRFECAALVWREVGKYAQQILASRC